MSDGIIPSVEQLVEIKSSNPKTLSILSNEMPPDNRNWIALRDYLSERIAYEPIQDRVFSLKTDGSIDYNSSISGSDMYIILKSKRNGYTQDVHKNLLGSDLIKKISPVEVLYDYLNNLEWDKEDRISSLLESMNISGDLDKIYPLIIKWLCNAYAFTFRRIDPKIDFKVWTREVLILHSDQSKFGKTEFFKLLGFHDEMENICRGANLNVFAHSEAQLIKDKIQKFTAKTECIFYLIDDIDQLLIRGGGELRGELTESKAQVRLNYLNSTLTKDVRAKYCGTTNIRDVLRNNRDNRFFVVTIDAPINFEASWTNIPQLWAQVQYLVHQEPEFANFTHEESDQIIELNKSYLYRDPLEDFLLNKIEYDSQGEISFVEVKNMIQEGGYQLPSDQSLGKKLKYLFEPSGGNLKRKVGNSPAQQKEVYRLRLKSSKKKNRVDIIDSTELFEKDYNLNELIEKYNKQ